MLWENILTAFDLTDLNDVNYSTLLCGGLSCLSNLLVLQLVIVCWRYSEVSVIAEFFKEFRKNNRLLLTVILTIISHLFLLGKLQTDEFTLDDCTKYCLRILYLSVFSVVILMLWSDDNVEFALSQDYKCSIGACWANGTILAYYAKSLEGFRDRVQKFEEKHPGVKVVKKLVLIAPLSCNIEGRISDRDERIHYVEDLETIECDEGANMNRKLISPVYKIHKDEGNNQDIFIASEFPSPLGTLWGERYGMDKDSKLYIRDCFLKELKDQLKHEPVIILEYDDQNPTEKIPLNQFIISSLQKEGLINCSSSVNKMQNGDALNYLITEN